MAFRTNVARVEAQRGVTLVELMVTLTVLGVLLAVGVPSLGRLTASNRLASRTNDLVGSLQLARSEAVRRSQGVALRGKDTSTHDYAAGWTILTDADQDGAPPGTVTATDGTVLRDQAPAAGTTIRRVTRSAPPAPFTYSLSTSADRDHVVFNSRGSNASGTPLFFRVCDAGNPALPGRVVQVSAVGRITLDSTKEPC